MRGGYVGKVLRVDLSSGKLADQELPGDDVLRKYIGCYGLGLRMLYDLLPPGHRATDPDNPMIFLNGPLTGLKLPSATNCTLTTKNFDTGFTVGRSHTHSNFGIRMKKAGYDGVIITGRSDKPVYLWIHDDKAELRDAGKYVGKDTHDTEDMIIADIGKPDTSVAAIGPAGENLVAGALIANDKCHSFSHSGVGGTMGSKKLKAIAVTGSGKDIPVYDAARIDELSKVWVEHARRPGHWADYAGHAKTKKAEYRGMLGLIGFCGKNFQVNQFTEFGLGWAKQKFTPQPCPRCVMGCSYNVEIVDGPHKGYVATLSGGGEALEGAGSVLGITGSTVFYLTDLYDRLGMEGSAAGCVMAMAIEAYERGLITGKDTDGMELKWGDPELAEKMLRKMVNREGFGDVLARGIKDAAEFIGGDAPKFAMHIKGSGQNLHDWRAAWGALFGQIISSGAGWPAPGADSFMIEPDAGYTKQTDRFDHRIKPMEARKTGIMKFMNDCTGFCWFLTWGLEDVIKLTADSISAATGWDYTPEEVLACGERVMQLERAFNVREGLVPTDDYVVVDRLVDAPRDGLGAGKSIKPYLKGMCEEYYRLMGWDPKTGKPWRNVLEKFDLGDVSKDLWGK